MVNSSEGIVTKGMLLCKGVGIKGVAEAAHEIL
jgi:hypothetical protein